MTGRLSEILSRNKQFEVSPAELSHLNLTDGEMVDPAFVANDRNWTLHCLDHDSRQALFLELPAGTDLELVPFAYMTQFDHAKRALLVPFDELGQLAQQCPFNGDPIFIFSIGRCGSTLLSKIFAGMPGVWSLSEPDALTNLALDRFKYESDDAAELLKAAVQLSFRPPAGREHDRFVVKLRSQSLFAMAPFAHAFPDATNIFLHRGYDAWTQSIYRFAQRLGFTPEAKPFEEIRIVWDILSTGAPTDYLEQFCDISAPVVQYEDLLAATWAISMDQYHSAVSAGSKFHSFSYDQLNNDRQASVVSLLQICGLDPGHSHAAMEVFVEDSQKGTIATNDRPTLSLTQAQQNRIAELLDKPLFNRVEGI